MLVQDCMTRNPISIRPESDPVAAIGLLKAGGFRHLPVLDSDGKLVGIVDRTDMETFLSKAGSPGVMKRNHRVDQVMSRNVVSVAPTCPLEEAASLMVQHKIGSLTVLEDGKLVGIITETDIFKILLELMGARTPGLRVTVSLPDRKGNLAKLTQALADRGANIISLGTYGGPTESESLITIKINGVDEPVVREALNQPGVTVVDLRGA